MLQTNADSPTFERGSLVPVATYLLLIAVLSALVFVSSSESPPPILGMAWGGFLVAIAVGAFKIEGVSPRSILPTVRTVAPALGTVIAFWALYNLTAVGLAFGDVSGFHLAWSRVAGHPLPYLAALLSSLLFTAIPEELVFRAYLQPKSIASIGGETRREVLTGVVIIAILFALFHLPRWFLASGHGFSAALAIRLLGLALAGLSYGLMYAITGNLWLVALFHATMNLPPFLVTVNIPSRLHLVVGLVEYTAIVSIVYLIVRVTSPDRANLVWTRYEVSSVIND